jgi:hypothetical protein
VALFDGVPGLDPLASLMADFRSINLDNLTTEPADLNRLAQVLDQLARYARDKARAMRGRLEGNVSEALVYEQWCERIYSRLPMWAQW